MIRREGSEEEVVAAKEESVRAAWKIRTHGD
jgi:hypothetical protein